jgi:hypothetical protein
MERLYYSQRNNIGKTNTKIDFAYLKKLFYTIFIKYSQNNYFNENFGYYDGNSFFLGPVHTKKI